MPLSAEEKKRILREHMPLIMDPKFRDDWGVRYEVALKCLETYDHDKATENGFRGYFLAANSLRMVDEYRRRTNRNRQKFNGMAHPFDETTHKGCESKSGDVPSTDEICEHIRSLLPNCRKKNTDFLIDWLSGMTQEAIAEIHNIPVGTVKSTIHRARQVLQQSAFLQEAYRAIK